jgi:hypothetical protein
MRNSPGCKYLTRPGAGLGGFMPWEGFVGMYSHSSTARRSKCFRTFNFFATVAFETAAQRAVM